MSTVQARLVAAVGTILVASCGGGGGGGGGGSTPPAVTVTMTASPSSVPNGGTTTLTWSSTNATACVASGGSWAGAKALNGTEVVGPITAPVTYVIACNNGGTPVMASAPVALAPVTSGSISGTIEVPAPTQTDSDTNDATNLNPTRNDTAATAQTLRTPVVLGGYANVAGQGERGPLQTSGDLYDYYRVNLVQGQVIELRVADAAISRVDDLDLDLIASNGTTLVDSSMGVGTVERLRVATSGAYYVRVFAFRGASSYILTIGSSGSSSAASDLVLSRRFVPGELLVKLRTAAEVSAGSVRITAQKPAQVASSHGLALEYSTPEMHSLMKVTPRTMQLAAAKTQSLVATDQAAQFESEEAHLKWQTLQAAKLLATSPEIKWAQPNWILSAHAVPNDPSYPLQSWHYEQINLPAAWDVTTGANTVVAAVIDTGVRRHPELVDRMIAGFDFVRGAGAGDGNDDDADPSDPGFPSQGSYVFHGTHVAGTIAATGNNRVGVTGASWNSLILPIRVLGVNGSGSTEDILQGMLFAGRLANRSGALPGQKADVINMSLGGPGLCDSATQDVVYRLRGAGVIIIASAGNDNANGDYYPAGCDGVVSVSSVGVDRARAPYSNYGKNVDVAAPGGDMSVDRNGDGQTDGVYSTYSQRDGSTYYATYAQLQGTSMAAPHVTGVVALMKSVNPALTPAQFDTLLANGALTDDIGPSGADELGVGLINAAKAVRAASTAPPSTPAQLGVAPSSINFAEVDTVAEVVIRNSGTGTLRVSGTSASAAWLSVTAAQVDANGLGTYRISVNRAGMSDGTYEGSIEFRGNPGRAVRAVVVMQVQANPIPPDAGQHYVLLVNPETRKAVDQAKIYARGASIAFTFATVPVGIYNLVAGTDLDNDGLICDDGEACAEYPIFAAPETFKVDGPLIGMKLFTGFRNFGDASMASDGTPVQTPRKGFERKQ